MVAAETDWAYLRRGLWLPSLVALATVIGAAASLHSMLEARTSEAGASERFAALQQVRNERAGKAAVAGEYAATYQRLAANGVFGNELRLQRIQDLRDAVDALKLPYARYTVARQRSFTAPFLPQGMAGPVYASRLELQLGLGHAGDLLRLMDRLDDSPGLFDVPACKLTRVASGQSLSAVQPNVVGECTLEWLSIPGPPVVADSGALQ